MNGNDRDIHFARFASLVAREIGNDVRIIFDDAYKPEEEYLKIISEIIAHRAYDLALHIVNHLDFSRWEVPADMSELITDIPDLTEWPTPPQE